LNLALREELKIPWPQRPQRPDAEATEGEKKDGWLSVAMNFWKTKRANPLFLPTAAFNQTASMPAVSGHCVAIHENRLFLRIISFGSENHLTTDCPDWSRIAQIANPGAFTHPCNPF
jgi:hypothetical protein